jgi:hypothetical protein
MGGAVGFNNVTNSICGGSCDDVQQRQDRIFDGSPLNAIIGDQKAGQIQTQSDAVARFANNRVSQNENGTLTEASQQNQNQLSSATTLLQAYAQEMSFIATAASTAIKAVGEAQATLARS